MKLTERQRKDLEAVRQKYLKLGAEIEQGSGWSDMQHTHSKLGIFIGDFVGDRNWRPEAYNKSEKDSSVTTQLGTDTAQELRSMLTERIVTASKNIAAMRFGLMGVADERVRHDTALAMANECKKAAEAYEQIANTYASESQ